MRALPVGEDSLLIDLETPREAQAMHAEVVRRRDAGLLTLREIVPGEKTVLLYGVPDAERLRAEVSRWTVPESAADSGPLLEIPVRYDGADLSAVAQLWGVTEDEVVGVHSGIEHRVAFCGFAPGFAYMTGLGDAFRVPRRDAPRTSVPKGSVALSRRVHRHLSAFLTGRLAAHRDDAGSAVGHGARTGGAAQPGDAGAVRTRGAVQVHTLVRGGRR